MAEVKLVIKQIDEGSQGIKQTGDRLNNLMSVAGKAAIALAAAGVAARKAFDLGKEGASLNQLTESFELMNKSVFMTPDLLDKMSQAARGTIKETDLMAGLLKLTAGASDELAKNLASNAPQLLEIAKASNKLNPALGDTAFLYDSIATGIKRASPLILDNLGIVVKVGDANERYAEQLGKTVEQLTAEEKQIALLNEVLRSGDQLIKQVGGSVDSQADAYARLEVKVGEATDSFKQFLGEALLPVIEAMSAEFDPLTENFIDANELAQQAKSLEEFINLLQQYNIYVPDSATARAWYENGQAIKAVTEETERLIKAAESSDRILMQNYGSMNQLSDASQQLSQEFISLDDAAGQYFQEALSGDLTQANLNQRIFEAAQAAGASATELAILGGALGLYSDEAVEAALKTAIIQAEIDRLAGAYAAGNMTVSQMTQSLQTFIHGLDATGGRANEAGQQIDELGSRLRNLPSSHTFTFNIRTTGSVPRLPAGSLDVGLTPFQHGGSIGAGQLAQVGEFNQPELFKQNGKLFMIPGDQGQVFSNSQSRGMMGGKGGGPQVVMYNPQFHGVNNARDLLDELSDLSV